jgi:DNA-binding MarR family transcriptional regulator
MHLHLLQVHLFSRTLRFVTHIDEDSLAAWRAFLTAHALVTRRISRNLHEAGLPDLSWYDLLWAIYRRPERRLRVNQLAREVVLSPTATSRFIDRVEAAGHVRREPDPADRRALQIVITDSGVELLRRMWPVYARGIDEYFVAEVGRSAGRVRAVLERMAASARDDRE